MRPGLSVLEPLLVERIIDEALTVLERIGVHINDERALATAPSSLTLHDRDGTPDAVLAGDNVHFVPASSALRVLDRRTRQVTMTPDVAEIDPAWSPDGQEIAFIRAGGPWVLIVETGAERLLAYTPGLDEVGIAWQPGPASR